MRTSIRDFVPALPVPTTGYLSTSKVFDDFMKGDFHALVNNFNVKTFLPYNIFVEGNKTVIELALAGYKKEEISVELVSKNYYNTLVISAEVVDKEENRVYSVRKLAKRNAYLEFGVTTNAVVTSAKFEDGILTVELEKPAGADDNSTKIEIQ